jgi:uncharacterized membrane protein YsdA (DUF1294 family)
MPPAKPYTAPRQPPTGRAGWFAIAAFAGLYLLAALRWQVPHGVALFYGVSSLVCAVAYAQDKWAAQAGRWRVRESSLLLLGLVGGWPGAIVAQQLLRHKTRKPSF